MEIIIEAGPDLLKSFGSRSGKTRDRRQRQSARAIVSHDNDRRAHGEGRGEVRADLAAIQAFEDRLDLRTVTATATTVSPTATSARLVTARQSLRRSRGKDRGPKTSTRRAST